MINDITEQLAKLDKLKASKSKHDSVNKKFKIVYSFMDQPMSGSGMGQSGDPYRKEEECSIEEIATMDWHFYFENEKRTEYISIFPYILEKYSEKSFYKLLIRARRSRETN